VQNAGNAVTFKISSDDKLREVYATSYASLWAVNTVTSSVTSNYCNSSCSAIYSNETTLQHCTI